MRQGRLTPKHFLSDYNSNEYDSHSPLSHTLKLPRSKSPPPTHPQLLQKLAAAETDKKWHQARAAQLETQREAYRLKVHQFIQTMGVGSWEEALNNLQQMLQGSHRMDTAQNQWTGIIEQYKKIIVNQQQKYASLELTHKDLQNNQAREAAAHLKMAELNLSKQKLEIKVTQLETKTAQLEARSTQLEQKTKQLQQEVTNRDNTITAQQQQISQLQSQLTQALLEKDELKDSYQLFQDKYTQEIKQFEVMEAHVEERLLEVEKEMTQHRRERAEHLQKIALLKQELLLSTTKNYFSFGSNQHTATQTEEPADSSISLHMNFESLVEQNSRLRKFILDLHQKRIAQKLPKHIEAEVQVIKRLQKSREQGHSKSIYIYEEQP